MTATSEDAPVAAVAIRGLVKVYRDFWHRSTVHAVDGVDLDIAPGEVLGLLGPNGSGKSTTIKLLLGLLHPTAGEVRVLGLDPRDIQTKARIGYLPEEACLYDYLTARETLDLFARLFNLDAATRHVRVVELLHMVGLASAADRPVREFSKGMARRLGLAQALVNDPELVILDEPTAGLDPIACRQVKDLILALRQRGRTVLLCSHLLADVEDVCSRVAVMYAGRIRALGRLAELLEQRDRVRLTVPELGPAQTRDLLANIRNLFGQEAVVDRPSISLEAYFLRVVREAQGAGPLTASGQLPLFLQPEQ
jgi:ABC-2 type transport system ATP-binding protein